MYGTPSFLRRKWVCGNRIQIFTGQALRQLGVAPERAVFIGHKKTELDGAHAVGMKTIALNFEAGAAADVFINHFHDLLSVPLLVMHPKLTRETEAS